jgi:hypothetical protein
MKNSMKNIILKSVLLIMVAFGAFTSCINDDSYSVPESTLTTSEFTASKTVAAINLAATNTAVEYTADDIIDAYVTSNDESGTFYKSISFQTIPTDNTAPIGFSVPINATTLYGKGFTPGRKVYIKLKGLYTAKVYGSLQIGSLYEGTIGRISEFEWQKHLFPSATIVPEASFVRTLTLAQAYTDANQNTLVELTGVQFAESSINRTYYDVDSGGGATNHKLSSSAGGTERIIRFSSFAAFTGKQVPTMSGKIRGVLTKYSSDFQFIVRYEDDIKLTQPRFDVNPPIGGSAIVFNTTFNETFESYSVTSSGAIFPKYVNDAAVGSRYWDVKSFSSNKYIQMSSFNSNAVNKAYLAMPIAFTPGNKLSFKSKDGYNDGNVLKVYYSTNYVAGGDISKATLVDITSSFAIASGTTTGYATNFTSSGNYIIPANLTGNGFFIFEYSGNGIGNVITTTMQLDDIVVN